MAKAPVSASIMIVDDHPDNLTILATILDDQGWDVYAFPRGDYAFSAAKANPPDLILLDICMPKMDGYEVCSLLKQEETLKDIPVIFLSALTEEKDKIKAFEVGGADYISKPFYSGEVISRVTTQLTSRSYKLHLESLVQQRTEELVKAHCRLRIWDDAKTQWLNFLAHEMRTPLNGIIGTVDLLLADVAPGTEMFELKTGYEQSVQRINKLIDDAMLLVSIDVTSPKFSPTPVSCIRVIKQAVANLQKSAQYDDVEVTIDHMTHQNSILGCPDLLEMGISDLLRVAACCTKNGGAVKITLHADSSSKNIIITFHTESQTLSEDALAKFFDVGGQSFLIRSGGDFGLSPALALRIFQLFDGSCTVCNNTQGGIDILATLPLLSQTTAPVN